MHLPFEQSMSNPSTDDTEPNDFDLPSSEAPLLRHDDRPRISYMQWMDETAERTRAWFARSIESRPPRRQPVPERFEM